MAAGNIICIVAAACLTYMPDDQKWNRIVAFWFTSFQASAMRLLQRDADRRASANAVRRVLAFAGDDHEQRESSVVSPGQVRNADVRAFVIAGRRFYEEDVHDRARFYWGQLSVRQPSETRCH